MSRICMGYMGFGNAMTGAAKAVDLELSPKEINYLEELYVPHALAGVMAQDGKQKAGNVV